MKSWSVGRLAGISVQIHATLLILLGFTALRSLSVGGGGLVWDLLFAVGLFGSVLLHELGHALTARSFGVSTRRIVLTPIGGIAELNAMPRSPRAEFWIALAGPVVSLGLAASSWTLAPVSGIFYGLAAINLMLGLFNLVPVFPSDGGRIFRAILSRKMGFEAGTQIAVKVARYLAVAMGVWGLYVGQWSLILVAMFLYWGASAELSSLGLRIPSWGAIGQAMRQSKFTSKTWDAKRNGEPRDDRAAQSSSVLVPDAILIRRSDRGDKARSHFDSPVTFWGPTRPVQRRHRFDA